MTEFCHFDLPDRLGEDFTAHNEMSRALYAAFAVNKHPRVPVRLNTNPRMLMLDPAYNRKGLSYQEYMTDPDVMGQCILEWLYWTRFLLPGDQEKGLPDAWKVHVDFQNFYDAAWLGGEVVFEDNQIPYAKPLLNDDNKRMLFDRGIPDPFEGEWASRGLRFSEHFERKSAEGWAFFGRPVEPARIVSFMATDGPFTTAATLRGATALCMDMLLDPGYVHELLEYLTDALIARMKAWRAFLGCPSDPAEWGTADDSVEMLSVEQYREFVLPCHHRLYEAICPKGTRGMHLCGNAQRLFPVLKQELNVTGFDTGFPVDFALFRKEMGPDVLISGGPRAPLFVEEDPAPLLRETECILNSGILEGGRFILQEGNNLPPRAPLSHCEAFYKLAVERSTVRNRSHMPTASSASS